MSQINILEFSGTGKDTVTPAEFLKVANHRMATANGGLPSDDKQIETIGLYLKSDSPAEEWFNEENTPRDTYKEFELSFKDHFPTIEKAKKTSQN